MNPVNVDINAIVERLSAKIGNLEVALAQSEATVDAYRAEVIRLVGEQEQLVQHNTELAQIATTPAPAEPVPAKKAAARKAPAKKG